MQSLDTIINSINEINKNVVYNNVEEGSKLNDLKALTRQLNLEDRVIFHGRKLAELMGQSDTLVVSMKGNEVISYTLPKV